MTAQTTMEDKRIWEELNKARRFFAENREAIIRRYNDAILAMCNDFGILDYEEKGEFTKSREDLIRRLSERVLTDKVVFVGTRFDFDYSSEPIFRSKNIYSVEGAR